MLKIDFDSSAEFAVPRAARHRHIAMISLCTGHGSNYVTKVPSGTMAINARVISGSDPGAVPGGSTTIPALAGEGAETGSTDV